MNSAKLTNSKIIKHSLACILLIFSYSVYSSQTLTNLLDNPGAENNYTGWSVTNGGSGWGLGGVHSGSKGWSSSYGICTLSQTIDLIAKGYTAEFLNTKPAISAGVYVVTNYFSGGTITIKVDLLNGSGAVISSHYISNYQTINNKSWQLFKTSINNYVSGVRKIRFTMSGRDQIAWAGQYGPSFDDAYVYLHQNLGAQTEDANNLLARIVTLNGSVYANDQNTTVTFEYGATPDLGTSVVADQSPVSGTSFNSVSKIISGLYPKSTYYARVCAINASDTSYGEIKSFKTPNATFSASSSSIGIGDLSESTATFNVSSTISWDITSDVDWLTILPSSGTGSKTITLTTSESNPTTETRIATLSLKGDTLPDITITVTQAKGAIHADPASIVTGSLKDTIDMNVTTVFKWKAVSNVDWITVPFDSVSGSGTLILALEENASGIKRTGNVVLSNNKISTTVPVTQGILKGRGTALSPYLISDYTGLKSVKDNLSAYYQITKDIDAAASINENVPYDFSPIGNSGTPFNGNFDGAGFLIKNLYINRSEFSNIGLFGNTNAAVIKNLGLSNCNIKGYYYVGAIIGYSGASNISNCFSTGNVSGEESVGGIIGIASGTTITDSYATTDVSGTMYIGGLVGRNLSFQITNCYAIGKVSGTYSAGGLVGEDMSMDAIVQSYYNRETTGQTDTYKGTPKSTSQMKTPSTFNGWDFTNTWLIRSDSTYPGLRVLNNAPFAFRDTIEVKGNALMNGILKNDYDIETLQNFLVYKITNQTGTGSIHKNSFIFPSGTLEGTYTSLGYLIGEVKAIGDTIWGNNAVAVFKKNANNPPAAFDDTVNTQGTELIKVHSDQLLLNDTDINQDVLHVDSIIISLPYPQHGTAVFSNDTITYTAVAGWIGIDSLYYVVSDGEFIDTALLKIIVSEKPIVTWNTPSAITYGTLLDTTQLKAFSNIPGTFLYTPPSGTKLDAGKNQILSVQFTPDDRITYISVIQTTTINVNKANPEITWNNPTNITYNTALSSVQLNAEANVPGIFIYYPAADTILNAGDNQNLTVQFTPQDNLNYTVQYDTVVINVDKASPVITWNNPDDITYGTALSATQLNAEANTSGAFLYNPSSGAILNAGDNQKLIALFTPQNTANYLENRDTVIINVSKASLNARANNQTAVQGSDVPSLTITYSGFVNNDTIADIDVLPTASTTGISSSPAGEYEISVTGGSDNNYAFTYTTGILKIILGTSINTINTTGVSAYPNPFCDNLTIHVKNGGTGKYIISSILGSIVEYGNIKDSKTSISLSHLKSGVYVLQVTVNGTTKTINIVKQ